MKISKEEFVKRTVDRIQKVKFRPKMSMIREQVKRNAEEDYDRLREMGIILVDEAELRKIIKACEEQPVQGENTRIHLQSRKEAFQELVGLEETET